jgi:hypothetical protein
MFGPRVVRKLAAVLLPSAILAAVVFGALLHDGARSQEPPRAAASDDEWINIIRETKASIAKTPLAPPSVPDGGVLTYDCADIPATAKLTQSSSVSSPDGKSGRTEFDFVDFAAIREGKPYTLVVPWGAAAQTCANDSWTRMVNASSDLESRLHAVQRDQQHICDQVRLMADGRQRTDVSLQPMSPRVAREYLAAFCP